MGDILKLTEKAYVDDLYRSVRSFRAASSSGASFKRYKKVDTSANSVGEVSQCKSLWTTEY